MSAREEILFIRRAAAEVPCDVRSYRKELRERGSVRGVIGALIRAHIADATAAKSEAPSTPPPPRARARVAAAKITPPDDDGGDPVLTQRQRDAVHTSIDRWFVECEIAGPELLNSGRSGHLGEISFVMHVDECEFSVTVSRCIETEL